MREPVESVFCLTPGHPSQRGVWWAGTTPHGLLRSEDGGEIWDSVVRAAMARGLSDALSPQDDVQIVCALSGG